MPTSDAGRIVVSGLSKNFGSTQAVRDLSFTVEPGSVTGFLGPNGAGKTTTLRMILGLAVPLAGTATIGGLQYAKIPDPGRMVGAVLEANSFHPGRTARNHLLVYCAAAGVPDSRADEVLAQVGLAPAGRMAARTYSLGMRQRLALATALLGNPKVLILDEPANGLDPEGIVWLRGFMRHMADAEGRTILVSSHLLSEVEQTVDRVVILAKGKMIREGTVAELAADVAEKVIARSPDTAALSAACTGLGSGVAVAETRDGALAITGSSAPAIGHAAWLAKIELSELRTERASLEELFLQLTADPTRAMTGGNA